MNSRVSRSLRGSGFPKLRFRCLFRHSTGRGRLAEPDRREIPREGGANFGPSWLPDGKRLIFSSRYLRPRSGNLDRFLVKLDGSALEQVTTDDSFDGFPMFSPGGRSLVRASNRHDAKPGDTNLFIADWAP